MTTHTNSDDVDIVLFDVTRILQGSLRARGLAVCDDNGDLLDPRSGTLQTITRTVTTKAHLTS